MDKPVFDKGRLVLPDKKTYLSFENTCVKCPEVAPEYANAQPPARDKIANAPPLDWQREQMPRGCPGEGGGGWAPLELIDALVVVLQIDCVSTVISE